MAISLLLMPQENKSIIVPDKKDKAPTISPFTGQCIACGNVDSHAWPCIIYYINASTAFYRRNLLETKKLLEKLKANSHVTTYELEQAIDRLQYVEDLKDGIKDDK